MMKGVRMLQLDYTLLEAISGFCARARVGLRAESFRIRRAGLVWWLVPPTCHGFVMTWATLGSVRLLGQCQSENLV